MVLAGVRTLVVTGDTPMVFEGGVTAKEGVFWGIALIVLALWLLLAVRSWLVAVLEE